MEEARVSDCELTAVGYKWIFDSAPAGIRSAKPGYGRAFFISRGRAVSRIQSLVLQIRRDTFLGFWRQVCAFLIAPFIYFKSPRSVLVCVAHPCILQKSETNSSFETRSFTPSTALRTGSLRITVMRWIPVSCSEPGTCCVGITIISRFFENVLGDKDLDRLFVGFLRRFF
jgi:hypothetical protein